jgi:hypothetical protein
VSSLVCFVKVKFEFGIAMWSKQVSDCHMLLLMESPTNIIFFPLYLSINFPPWNLFNKIN